ncbi:MAG TPA: site-specific integrase [Salinimicrobium sp.]|nr:site-specific integrase [Salinimicrobium sp.]
MPRVSLIWRQSRSQRKNKSNEGMIFVSYTHAGKTTLFFTKKNVDRRLWDKKNQAVKRGYVGYVTCNVYLSKEKQKVEDGLNTTLMNGIEPTVTYIKDFVRGRNTYQNKVKPINFWEFVAKYMDNAEKKLKHNTIRSYKTGLNNLKKFERHKRIVLDWHNIDLDFYNDYFDYYINHLGLKLNGFGKIIKMLKSILNEATQEGYNDNKIYQSKNFKVQKENVDNIYLNEHELKAFIELDLSQNKKLEKTRDLFVIGCYTGLRFSDLAEVNYRNINGNNLRIRTQKTGSDVVIPILDEIQPIINKYNGNLPKPYTNQVMNRYLKELGEIAGMNSSFNTYNKKGGQTIKTTFKKWEMISTHTARRSFATNMYLRGYDTMMIMQITGHSSEKVFMNYIKVSQEENARRFHDLAQKNKNN